MALGTAFLPLRRYASFGGRATRTELLLFFAFLALVSIAISYGSLLLEPVYIEWAQRALIILTFCPILAVMTRRLHDTGRSGRWLLIGLPLLGFLIWEAIVQFRDPAAQSPIEAMPLVARLALAMTGVVLAALLLWDENEGGNAYGPNPRGSLNEAAT